MKYADVTTSNLELQLTLLLTTVPRVNNGFQHSPLFYTESVLLEVVCYTGADTTKKFFFQQIKATSTNHTLDSL